MKTEEFLTVQQAMQRLGVTRAALYYAMDAGKLKYTEKYGKRLFREKDLAAYQPRAYRGRTRENASS